MNHSQIVSFIWGVADLIRDTFKRGKYQDVILPFTVLRRLDCVLAPTKVKVLDVQAACKDKIDNLEPQLQRASGFAFYNTSRYDFDRLLADAPHIAANLRNYIAGFSSNMRQVLEKFDFDNTIAKLDESGLLYQVVQQFADKKVNLHPDAADNFTMGTIFEELIRKFNEALNENPGEHFTPRDVVHLMVDLLLAGDEKQLQTQGIIRSVYDPCCGSGGMLTITKEHITIGEIRDGKKLGDPVNREADIHVFGQEVNPETFAICKSDLYMKSQNGRDAESILFGSTLSNNRHPGVGSLRVSDMASSAWWELAPERDRGGGACHQVSAERGAGVVVSSLAETVVDGSQAGVVVLGDACTVVHGVTQEEAARSVRSRGSSPAPLVRPD